MSTFPYTREQAKKLAGHARGQRVISDLDVDWAREVLGRLHDAGITVTFPEPRFYVIEEGDYAYVRDRTSGLNVAWFYDHARQQHARGHADRLNREVGR